MELMDCYEIIKRKVIQRKESFDRFLEFLENETTWLTSPASTRFHLAEEEGLLRHSVWCHRNPSPIPDYACAVAFGRKLFDCRTVP